MSSRGAGDAVIFEGPGEMRARFRSMDWAASALGPVAAWPVELRLMVGVCLDSGFPMSLHWGPSLAVLYNDAFIPIMGSAKHPQALGQPTRDVWAEQWDEVIGPLMQRVVQFASPVTEDDLPFILERNGYAEECYFTFSYSPILGPERSAGGVFNIVTETTTKVLAERRLRLVRNLGAVSATQTGSMAQTCLALLDVLASTRQSLPFAVALLKDGTNPLPRGVGAYGLAADAWSLGMSIEDYADESTVIERVMQSGHPEILTGLRDRYSWAILPSPIGPLIPDEAMVVPLHLARDSDAVGVLVLGVSPYRRMDDEYRSFLALVAAQVGIALADNRAYQEERNRVQVLADLDLVKMEFFQNVSHELRTPLTLLQAPLRDVLDAPDGVHPDHRANLEIAVRAAGRLRRIVDALLDFAQSEAGTLTPDRQPVDVGRLTAEAASMFRSAAERAELRFEVSVPETALLAAVDAGMWTTIVTNLVANAVKFTARGEVSVRLQHTIRSTDRVVPGTGLVVLTVTDTGIGIPAEEQPRVFERFYRSARTQQGGAGIGLALVADLIHAHDGEVSVTSAPNAGSTFTVTVPVTHAGPTPQRPPVAPPASRGATQSRERPVARASGEPSGQTRRAAERITAERPAAEKSRVLVVEDDPDLRAYLARLLTADGWQVTAVVDAEAALSAVQAESDSPAPDLVLTDVMLPGRSGLELVGELRAIDSTARLPIIVLTAVGGVDAAAEGLAAGADDYITKPFSSQELLARVRANIELHHVREGAVDDAEGRAVQVREALNNSRTIGTAIGVVMSTYRLTAEQGFQLLVKASQDHNRKLRDIAADVASNGKLPFRPTDADALVIKITSTPPR